MPARKVKCPKCGKVLSVPERLTAAPVRCGACHTAFRLPDPGPVPDETIADWLNEGPEEDEGPAAPAGPPPAEAQAPAATETPPPPPEALGGLRVVSVERRGVLLEFAADHLRNDIFRCALPRCCAHCLARAHLSAHLIIFTSQLRDSISLESEHKAGHLAIPQDRLGRVHGRDMLKLLPEVPNVPAPGNLPMPYWVCDMCSGAGSISGQIQVDTTGRGFCRLFIRNLNLALSFFANTGGEGTKDFERLREFFERMEDDRWDALASVVRHRLEQWFRLGKGERFVAYVPDRAFVRTEDGMNGLIISDRRLVYHHPPLHQEVTNRMTLTLQLRSAEGNEVASVEAPDFKRRSITLDRGGMMLFRRALSQGGFKAEWK